MIYVARSKISGRGAFTDRLLRPGIPLSDDIVGQKTGYNHSCVPNCIIVRNNRGHSWFVVPIRLIEKGEELTVDYRHGSRRKIRPQSVMKRPPRDCRPCKCPACKEKP